MWDRKWERESQPTEGRVKTNREREREREREGERGRFDSGFRFGVLCFAPPQLFRIDERR